VLTRLVLGAAVLLTFIAVRRVRLPPLGIVWAHVTVTAVFGMVAPFFLLAWGERSTSAALAGVLTAATPLLTLAIATTVLQTEKASWQRTSLLIAGFVGVIIVIAPWQSSNRSLIGQLACLGAAGCYAIQTAYVRRFLSRRGIAPLSLAAAQLIVASALQAVVTPLMPWQTPSLAWSIVFSVVVLGAVNTGVAYVLYFWLIRDIGATTAAAVNYFVPILAVLIGVVVLADRVTGNMVIGTALVLLSFALAENRLRLTSIAGRKAAVGDQG